MSRFVRLSTFFAWIMATIVCGTGVILASFYLYLTPNLPEVDQLKTIYLQTPLRIYSKDRQLIAEFGEKRRTPVQIETVPDKLINAFVAAEDNRFFEHHGIDFKGLSRAVVQLITTGHIQSGGSTITMQVAKNFFLSREKKFIRKFNEILLALQIEQALTKKEILELYLNKIYLGNRAYGIQAAANVYYGRGINDLDTAQMAMIAGLPKAPSRYNPIANPSRALQRRNWILQRMRELGFINQDEFDTYLAKPVTASLHRAKPELDAPYVAEMARREVIQRFGADAYTDGYEIYLTVDSKLQRKAQEALRKGLEDYDLRHGYRGPIAHMEVDDNTPISSMTQFLLQQNTTRNDAELAIVTKLEQETASLETINQKNIKLRLSNLGWARPYISNKKRGPRPKSVSDIFSLGDVVLVKQNAKGDWRLTQNPVVQGALVSLSPKDGAILALSGGYDFNQSKYNRAIQAKRQPGSNLKPFIYTSALENGATASTLINDAPIVFEDKNLEASWRPENSGGRFYGPTRLRRALYKSRNLVSIRLLKETGITRTLNTIEKFGFDRKALPKDLSLALGSAGITPIDIAAGYSMIANGGHYISPYLVQRIVNHDGQTVYQAKPLTVCDECTPQTETEIAREDGSELALNIAPAPRIADARIMYIMHSIMKDVIKKGTGRKALALHRNDIAGKTGTTNDQKDAWFSGFNTNIETTVWVGFDQPESLGRREYGARAALPIWMDYMKTALKDMPESNMPRPEGLVTVKINRDTGQPAEPGDPDAIFEIYRQENAPKITSQSSSNGSANKEKTYSTEEIF